MAVKMRLKRMGKKRNPIYRIVVAEKRQPLLSIRTGGLSGPCVKHESHGSKNEIKKNG